MKNKFCLVLALLLLTFLVFVPAQDLSAQEELVLISTGSAAVSSGSRVEVPITVDPRSNTVGAITVRLQYDPDVLSAVSCESFSSGDDIRGVCNPAASTDTVVVTVVTLEGISTEFTLMSIIFQAVGESGTSSALSLSVETIADPGSGDDIDYTLVDGQLNVGDVGPFISCAEVSEIPQSECEALVAIYNANPSASLDDWLTTNTPCSWQGISCGNGRVTDLQLDSKGLATLPSEIGNLTALTGLVIDNNNLTSLPPEIGNLIALLSLDLSFNALENLPLEIGNLTNLESLYLGFNYFESLPPEIGDLTALKTLWIFENTLTNIPSEIGNLANLEQLKLAENDLTSLPAEIGNLTPEGLLDLFNNNLSSLPLEIAQLVSLQTLDVRRNPLTSQPVQIDVMIEGNGTILRSISGPAPLNGAAGLFYMPGTSIQLFAEPDEGWRYQSVTCENIVDESSFEYEDGMVVELDEQNATCTFVFVEDIPVCRGLEQEAEDGLLDGAFVVGNDSDASGGQYVHVRSGGAPEAYAGPDDENFARYCVNVTEAGRYRILATSAAASEAVDSFYVQVNGEPANGYLWNVPTESGFSSSYVGDSGGMNPVEVDLAAGEHILRFSLRTTGTQLDKFVFEPVPDEPPVACGPLQQEAEAGALSGGFVVADDERASDGKFIHVTSGVDEYAGPNSLRKASYCFNVAEAGTYAINTRVDGLDDGSNSFYVRVNGAPDTAYKWHVPLDGGYIDEYVHRAVDAPPITRFLSAGEHTVTVYLRERKTRFDTIALERQDGPPPPTTCGPLQQEAEAGALSGGFTIGTDEAASDGQYVHVPNRAGDEYDGLNPLRKADYCFSVTEAGDYTIKTNVYGQDTGDNSFYVQVDGAPTAGYKWHSLINTTYAEDYVNAGGRVVVTLTPGDHTVSVYLREDGTRLDTIALEPYVQAVAAVDEVETSPTAAGLYGHLQLQQGVNPDSVDFSQFVIHLVDAAGVSYRTSLDTDGGYRFDDLPVGDYQLTLVAPAGYASLMPADVSVSLGSDQIRRVVPDVVKLDVEQIIYLPSMFE